MENFEQAIEQLNSVAVVPSSIEFTVQEDFINNLPQIISNVEQLGLWAKAQTESDKNLILTSDDDFDKAKKRCADIKKVVKSINDKRISVKKAYSQPIDIFEKKLKEVTAILENAHANLWGQVTKQEQEKKDKLETQYRNYFESKAEELGVSQYRSWKQIFNEKWLNKSVKADTVLSEIDNICTSIKNELTAIKALSSEFELVLLERYAEGYTMTDIINYDCKLKSQKQAVETQKQEVKGNSQPQPIKTEETPKEQAKTENEEVFETVFKVWTTKEQLVALGAYLRENGIKYGKAD